MAKQAGCNWDKQWEQIGWRWKISHAGTFSTVCNKKLDWEAVQEDTKLNSAVCEIKNYRTAAGVQGATLKHWNSFWVPAPRWSFHTREAWWEKSHRLFGTVEAVIVVELSFTHLCLALSSNEFVRDLFLFELFRALHRHFDLLSFLLQSCPLGW